MFDFKEANNWLRASGRGEWKVLESSSDDRAGQELNKIAERQPRGKSMKTGRNLAEVRKKSNVYYFESAQGNSAGGEPQVLIFILGFGSSDSIQNINDLMGCEPSGAVSPEHMFAVEALSDSCTDFEYKIKEIVKKVVNGEKIKDEEQKALIQTFLPPYQEGYEVQPGLIGGGLGFRTSASSVPFSRGASTASFTKFMQEAAETPQMQQFVQHQIDLENKENQGQGQRGQQKPTASSYNNSNSTENQQQDTYVDPRLVLHETSLVALITSGVPLHREQIRSVLKSLESSVVYENNEGRQVSATLAALNTPSVITQIDDFLNSADQEIVKYRNEHNIRPSEKFNAIKTYIEAEKQKKRDGQKAAAAKSKTSPEEDLEQLSDYLDAQREIDPPHHEVEKLPLPKPKDPKLSELTVEEGSVTINNEIRTDKHQRRV